ncbi:hypothetical protein B7463_g11279, partial [Scytalidium lignicola]
MESFMQSGKEGEGVQVSRTEEPQQENQATQAPKTPIRIPSEDPEPPLQPSTPKTKRSHRVEAASKRMEALGNGNLVTVPRQRIRTTTAPTTTAGKKRKAPVEREIAEIPEEVIEPSESIQQIQEGDEGSGVASRSDSQSNNTTTTTSSSATSSQDRMETRSIARHNQEPSIEMPFTEYNVQKSYGVMAALLMDRKAREYNVIAIQEPYLNSTKEPWKTHNPYPDRYQVYMQTTGERPHVCFLIDTTKIDKETIRITSRGHNVLTTHIKVKMEGVNKEISIHNIYNPHNRGLGLGEEQARFADGEYEELLTSSALPQLDQALARYRNNPQMVVGDFNLYHEMWFGNEPFTERDSNQTDFLIPLMEENGLELALEPGTITRPANNVNQRIKGTCIDLVWATQEIQDRIHTCRVDRRLDHASDHYPVATKINIEPNPPPAAYKKAFKQLDAKLLATVVREQLPVIQDLISPAEIDSAVAGTIKALNKGIEEAVPEVKITRFSRPGFTNDVKDAIKSLKNANRRKHRYPTEENFKAFQEARAKRDKAIFKCNRQLHRDRVSNVRDEAGLWRLAKWVKNREAPRVAYTPDIQRKDKTMAEELQGKCEAFREVHFPKPPEANLEDIEGVRYPQSRGDWPEITEWEVTEALRYVPPDKAPGEDGIPNRVLKTVAEVIAPTLVQIFNASLRLGYCPEHFKKSVTVILRKPSKPDYSEPKAYRPIALMNTIGKVMDTILAKRMQYLAERRLLHNMRKRGLPLQLVNWMASYLQNRKSKIRLAEGTGPEFTVDTGIPQGSPLSPILYLFYNADLVETKRLKFATTTKGGYIDDVGILAEGKDTAETIATLTGVAQECEEWARRHASVFAVDKFELMHFVHKYDRRRKDFNKEDLDRPLTILAPSNQPPKVIKSKKAVRYLGVIFDPDLGWEAHMKHIKERATKAIAALQAITALLGEKDMLKTLNALQKSALCVATGAFCTTALAALEKETYTMGIDQVLMKRSIMSTDRIMASPIYKTLITKKIVRQAGIHPLSKRQSTLQRLEVKLEDKLKTKIGPLEPYTHHAVPPWWQPPIVWIAKNDEIAAEIHDRLRKNKNPNQMWIYTDGSGKGGQIGAAAWCEEREWMVKAYLGPDSHSNVYAASLMGISEALGLALRARSATKQVNIFTTNQAAILSVQRPQLQLGQYILREIAGKIDQLHQSNIRVFLHWIPAWAGGSGAEKADTLAKEATGESAGIHVAEPATPLGARTVVRPVARPTRAEPTTPTVARPQATTRLVWTTPQTTATIQAAQATQTAPVQATPAQAVPRAALGPALARPIYRLQSAIKRIIKKECLLDWRKEWPMAEAAAQYRQWWGNELQKGIEGLYKMQKAMSSVLIQMRTGKIGLKAYLHRINRAESSLCDCGEDDQTVRHVLETCYLFEEQRDYYFSGLNPDIKTVLGHFKYTSKAVNIMLATGLLDQFKHYKPELYREHATM